jgi:hypothetical protein
LGLAGLAVERVALAPAGARIVQLITDDPEAARCPACRTLSTSGKDWVLTRPHDLPSGGGQVSVQWRKRRWRCRTLDCARQSFTEQVAQVPAGMRTTTRLRTALAVAVEDGRDQSEVALAHGVSWPTVQRAVVEHAAVELVEPEPTTVLGMDETRFGRPRWLPDGTHADGQIRWQSPCAASAAAPGLAHPARSLPPRSSYSTTNAAARPDPPHAITHGDPNVARKAHCVRLVRFVVGYRSLPA